MGIQKCDTFVILMLGGGIRHVRSEVKMAT